jgi:hypothetical protein
VAILAVAHGDRPDHGLARGEEIAVGGGNEADLGRRVADGERGRGAALRTVRVAHAQFDGMLADFRHGNADLRTCPQHAVGGLQAPFHGQGIAVTVQRRGAIEFHRQRLATRGGCRDQAGLGGEVSPLITDAHQAGVGITAPRLAVIEQV